MKKLARFGLVLTSLTGCAMHVDPAQNHPEAFATVQAEVPEYVIGAGDDLSIIMPYNPELNYEGFVGPDGRFTLPVAGTIKVAGLTVAQAGAAIDAALANARVVRAAVSSVTIRTYAPVVYVGGEVKLPGSIPLRQSMDPLQAILAAGGLQNTAHTEEVVLIRVGPDGHPLLRTINIRALIEKGDVAQAVALQPRDTIFVPKSTIAEVDLWIDQHINQTLPFNRSVSYSYNQNPVNPVP